MEMIVSKDNPRFKLAKSLLNRKHRELHQLSLIEGIRLVKHVMERHPEWVNAIYVNAMAAEDTQLQFNTGVLLAEELFKELSDTVHSQGVIAVIKTTREVFSDPSSVILALDGIQDPGNMGTMIRTCDAVGRIDLLLSKGCVDIYNPKVLRSAMGSLFDVQLQRNCDLIETLSRLKMQGYTIVGAALEGASDLFEFKWPEKCVIVIGNEGNGISQDVLDICDLKVKIPLRGQAESLNASVAAGILIYDAVRNLKP